MPENGTTASGVDTTLEQSVIRNYTPYLGILDGTNEALLLECIERIEKCKTNDATRYFLSMTTSCGAIQKVVERHEIWSEAKQAILEGMRYDAKSKAMMDIRDIKRGSSETIPAFIHRFKEIVRAGYGSSLSVELMQLIIGWCCNAIEIPERSLYIIAKESEGDVNTFFELIISKGDVESEIEKFRMKYNYNPNKEEFTLNPFQKIVPRETQLGFGETNRPSWSSNTRNIEPMDIGPKLTRLDEIKQINNERTQYDMIEEIRKLKIRNNELMKYSNTDRKREIECCYCKRKGHMKHECNQLAADNGGNRYRENTYKDRGDTNRGNSYRENNSNRGNPYNRGNTYNSNRGSCNFYRGNGPHGNRGNIRDNN